MNQNATVAASAPGGIEHLVMERRLSQISNNKDELAELVSAANQPPINRSPRSSSIRRRSEMYAAQGVVVSVPMPLNHTTISPQNSVLLAPPTHEQLAQRRFSEVNAAIERHNMRKAAKRSQSVMYRGSRRKSMRTVNTDGVTGGAINSTDLMALQRHRRKSVKM